MIKQLSNVVEDRKVNYPHWYPLCAWEEHVIMPPRGCWFIGDLRFRVCCYD